MSSIRTPTKTKRERPPKPPVSRGTPWERVGGLLPMGNLGTMVPKLPMNEQQDVNTKGAK